MKNNALPVVALGLLSAVLALAPLIFNAPGIGLSLFAAAPLVHLAITRGWQATLAAGGIGAGAALFGAGLGGATLVLAFAAVHALIAAWTLGQTREEDGRTVWQPLAVLMMRLALYVAVLVSVALLASGYQASEVAVQLQTGLDEVLAQLKLQNPQFQAPAPDAIARQSQLFANLLPILMPVAVLFALFLSLRTGSRYARQNNMLARPPVDVPAEAGLPPAAAPLFGLAAALAAFGVAPTVSGPFAGAFGFAFLCVGLAVIHFVTRGIRNRRLTLVALYVAVILPHLWLAVVVWTAIIALGLAETLGGVRRRVAVPST